MDECEHALAVPDGANIVCGECGEIVGKNLPPPPKKVAGTLEKLEWYGGARIKTFGGVDDVKVFYDKGPSTRIYETTRDGFLARLAAGTLFSDE